MTGQAILTEILDYLRISQKELAEKSKVAKQTISAVIKGKYDLSQENRKKIGQAFPQISKEFLFEGKGKVGKTTNHDQINQIHEASAEYVAHIEDLTKYKEWREADPRATKIKVPLVPLTFFGTFVESGSNGYRFSDLTFEKITIEKRPDVKYDSLTMVLLVEGNSMSPTIPDGSKVLCTWVNDEKWPYLNGLHAVSLRNGTQLVKWVHGDGDKLITLTSDNPKYGEMKVQLTDLLAVWKLEYGVYTPYNKL